jgi:2-polyprenyl-3-methyl-5-hydroxy-6-metoxy-1,4-benzoquinol methylase
MRPLLTVGRRVRLRHVGRAVERVLSPGARVLDAGCADGHLAVALARAHPDCSFLGIDPDAREIASARAHAGALRNITIRQAAIGDTLADTFDVVVCTDVLEHIGDDRAAVAWLGDHVASGGHLILHVPGRPQRHPIGSVRAAMAAEIAGGEGPHLREGYSISELEQLARDAGLTVEQSLYTFHAPPTRVAADIDTWTFLRGRREVKAALLPVLLAAAAAERSPSRRPGNGVLLAATRAAA